MLMEAVRALVIKSCSRSATDCVTDGGSQGGRGRGERERPGREGQSEEVERETQERMHV